MSLVQNESLLDVLDAVNAAAFNGEKLTPAERLEAANFIAGWQGKPGSYWDMFGMPEKDHYHALHLFTGETLTSGAGKSHVVGQEACRALSWLDVDEPQVTSAHQRALAGFERAHKEHLTRGNPLGMYCCGTCSVAFWRNLSAGKSEKREEIIHAGLVQLSKHHKEDGRYRRFPFFYTMLALLEMDTPEARAELLYLQPTCERALKHSGAKEPFQRRQKLLMERVLAV